MRSIVLISILTLAFCTSCEPDELEPIDPGYRFFNMDVGRFVSYDVDSIIIDIPSGVQDTFRYQVKEYLDTAFFDLQGRRTVRIERSYRADATAAWNLKKIWVANRTSTTAEKVEENVRLVKMVFPIDDQVEWDGNAQNSLEEWTYHYKDIEQLKEIGGLSFPRTVTVQQRDLSNLVEQEFAQEIFAYDIGMIYKQLDTLRYSLSGGVQTLRTGIKLKMTAFEYGEE